MGLFWNLVISGAVSGAIYSMMASALVLTCQTSGVFNFAQGAEAFVVAYCYYELHTGQGLPIWLAAVLSVVVFAPLMAVGFDLVVLRRLAEAPVFARVVGTVGLLVAVPALALWVVETICNGIFTLGLPTTSQTVSAGGTVPGIGPTPPSVWHLGFIGLHQANISSDQVAVFAAAAVAAVALWLVLRHTRIGLEMRATVDRRQLSGLRGMSLARTSAVSWVLTMILVGLGGLLIAPLFQLDSTTITLVVFGSLPAVALAGLRSIPLAFGAGLLMGVIQDLIAGYGHDFLPSSIIQLSGFRSSLPFVLTVILLFFLGRDRSRQAGSAAEEKPRPDHRHGLPPWRRLLPWVIVTAVFVGFTLQASTFTAGAILAPGLAVSIVLLSFVVVTGIGGMISLAQATFVTAGGFMAGWLSIHHFGVSVPLVVLQFAPFEAAKTNPAIALMIKRVHKISASAPLTQGIEAGYFAADQFIDALRKAGRNLTAERLQQVADHMTYGIKNTVGPTHFPRGQTVPTSCGSTVTSNGTSWEVAYPYLCTNAVKYTAK